jgi:hypothetical protein
VLVINSDFSHLLICSLTEPAVYSSNAVTYYYSLVVAGIVIVVIENNANELGHSGLAVGSSGDSGPV